MSTKDADGDGVPDAEDCDPDDPAVGAGATWHRDADGDGYGDPAATFTACGTPADGVTDATDCDDAAAAVHPGAAEIWYDGADEDCSGGSDFDQDGDGWARDEECDDTDPTRYPDPSVPESWYDGVDDNCDGNDGDQDGDGWYVAGYPFEVPAGYTGFVGDCADAPDVTLAAINGFPDLAAADVHPGTAEVAYDGIDQDCAGDDDFDADGDGFRTAEWPDDAGASGEDCDDADPAAYPGATDEWYDGVDADCRGNDDFDQDYDGSAGGGGPDCDDLDAGVHPEAVEDCATETDEDCDGTQNGAEMAGCVAWYADTDADGWGSDAAVCQCVASIPYLSERGGDCDDADATVNPDVAEVCDGADQDCDGEADEGLGSWYVDADGDGWGTGSAGCAGDGRVERDGDCDDTLASVYPGAPELCDVAPNDCTTAGGWTSDAERGLAATEVGTTWTDVTARLSGGPGSPAAYTLPVDGTLWVCPGTWYVALSVPAGARTSGVFGPVGPSSTILDGGGAATVVTAAQAGVATRIEGVTLTDGVAARGGGLAVTAGEVELVDAEVVANGATSEGGGVYVSAATLTIAGGRIASNTAGRAGGGIYASESVLAVEAATIEGNGVAAAGDGYGGGIAFGAVSAGALSLTGSSVIDNLLVASGTWGEGAGVYIYSYSGDGLVLDDLELGGNSTLGPTNAYGGGLRLIEGAGADVSLERLTVYDNTVEATTAAYGAGVHLYQGGASAMAILDSTISGNLARSGGTPAGAGLLYGGASTGSFTLTDSILEDNALLTSTGASGGTGGGAYLETSGSVVVEGCVIDDNSAYIGGGISFVPHDGASGTVRGSALRRNGNVGVAYFPVGASTALTIEDSPVSDHTAYGAYVVADAGMGAALTCLGSSASDAGFYRNGYAGLVNDCAAYGGTCSVIFSACDLGPEGTGDDNVTTDVWWDGTVYDGYGADASFMCGAMGCA